MENSINNLHSSNSKKTTLGIILLGFGAILLIKQAGFFMFPHWVFSWQVIMIGIGLYMSSKPNARKSRGILVAMIGFIFLLPNIIPALSMHLLWPVILIGLGVNFLMRRDQVWKGGRLEKPANNDYQHFDNQTK